jgi:hypothetical protein
VLFDQPRAWAKALVKIKVATMVNDPLLRPAEDDTQASEEP